MSKHIVAAMYSADGKEISMIKYPIIAKGSDALTFPCCDRRDDQNTTFNQLAFPAEGFIPLQHGCMVQVGCGFCETDTWRFRKHILQNPYWVVKSRDPAKDEYRIFNYRPTETETNF
jgi:hypothetical protein